MKLHAQYTPPWVITNLTHAIEELRTEFAENDLCSCHLLVAVRELLQIWDSHEVQFLISSITKLLYADYKEEMRTKKHNSVRGV